MMTRRDILAGYDMKKSSLTLAGGASLRKSEKKPYSRVRHSSFITLQHNKLRIKREERFQTKFTAGVKDVAAELDIDLNDDQLYNCIGIVEVMKRYKGVVILGPVCSGKTQLVKLATQCLLKSFEAHLRTSYISPNTFAHNDLYGPVLAYD